LHRSYLGQSYLVSYWNREVGPRKYAIVAWHDLGRIIRETFPLLYGDPNGPVPQRLNVIDEEGRLLFGPPLRTGEFTVGMRFPTTLYGWRVQVAPVSSEAIAGGVQNQRILELLLVGFSAIVIVAGVATLLILAARQRRLNALKSEFVANVSHELRTPLALVRMFGEMLESGRVTSEEKRAEYLGIIVRESERLTGLIENVLDFARLERDGATGEFALADVREIVAKAVDAHRYRAEREGVTLETSLSVETPPLKLDERALGMAISNLIDNALKYGAAGRYLKVSIERHEREIVIAVEDHGPGVAKEEQTRIFERFVRGDARGRAQIRGSGIGLALVKEIAKSHAGRVWVEGPKDTKSNGAIFCLALPCGTS
jgi:two-component system, OmpR family, phosphate regulon sensor histidine kinase PhoR